MIELAHAAVGRAAIVNHLDVGKDPPRVSGTTHGIGADLEALAARGSQLFDGKAGPQHQHVARRVARQRRTNHQSRRVLIARHVLERVHRRLQLPGANSLADFDNESSALAPVRQQLAGLVNITSGLELDDLDIGVRHSRYQTAGNLLRLDQGHGALACADPQPHPIHALRVDRADAIALGRRGRVEWKQ